MARYSRFRIPAFPVLKCVAYDPDGYILAGMDLLLANAPLYPEWWQMIGPYMTERLETWVAASVRPDHYDPGRVLWYVIDADDPPNRWTHPELSQPVTLPIGARHT